MGISINPASALFKYFENKKEKELRIADYLDQIAVEAEEIAKIWETAVKEIQKKSTVDLYENKKAKAMISPDENERYHMANCVAVSRLSEFYRSASSVLGKTHNDKTDYIVFHIAEILQKRNLTKELVESQLAQIKTVESFDDSNTISNLKELNDSVLAMHKEAAALYVFAKSFRAKIK